MNTAIQDVQTITFPCEEWHATRTPQGELVSIKPMPGTWTLISGEDSRRFAEKGVDVKGFFACPRCGQVGFIASTFNPPKELGDTKPLPEMTCRHCNFSFRVILKDWDKRRLYCACYETFNGTNVDTHKEYLHAQDEAEANKFFWAQHGLEVYKLVGIAPVIGFFVPNPKNDRVLVV